MFQVPGSLITQVSFFIGGNILSLIEVQMWTVNHSSKCKVRAWILISQFLYLSAIHKTHQSYRDRLKSSLQVASMLQASWDRSDKLQQSWKSLNLEHWPYPSPVQTSKNLSSCLPSSGCNFLSLQGHKTANHLRTYFHSSASVPATRVTSSGERALTYM